MKFTYNFENLKKVAFSNATKAYLVLHTYNGKAKNFQLMKEQKREGAKFLSTTSFL